MSSGNFVSTKYQLDTGNGGYICRARVQQETLDATFASTENAVPSGAVNLAISAQSAKGKREFGIGMRYVVIRFTGEPPTGYSGDDVRIPVLSPTTYAAWVPEATGTYLSTAAKIVKRFAEDLD